MSKQEREGFFWILAAAAGFAFIPTIVKTVYSQSSFEPLDLAVWRFILAVPLIWALVGLRRRSGGPSRGRNISAIGAMFSGLLFAAAVLCAFFALERLPGSTYVVLFFTYPAMIVLLSALLGESITPRAWLALALALVGVGLTVPDFVVPDAVDPVGVFLALINAAIVAVYYLDGAASPGWRRGHFAGERAHDGRHIDYLIAVGTGAGPAASAESGNAFRTFLYRDPGNGAAGVRHQHCDSADWTGTGFSRQYY